MKLALAGAGATLADVVKVTVYLGNVDDRQKVNEVRKEYFGDTRPASTLIQISGFAIEGMLIEIEAVAVARWGGSAVSARSPEEVIALGQEVAIGLEVVGMRHPNEPPLEPLQPVLEH